MICVMCLNGMKYIHDDWYMNTRVGKHNLKGSEKKNEHENSGIELNCIGGWRLAPLVKKGNERVSL